MARRRSESELRHHHVPGKNVLIEPIDEGDLEVFHPVCRSKVLILDVEMRRGRKHGTSICTMFVRAICKTCDKYVYLRLGADGCN